MVVVLGILGMTTITAMPFLQQWKEASDLRSAAGKVAGAMLTTRMKAVVKRSDCTVSVDYAKDTYRILPLSGEAVQPPQSVAGSVDVYQDSSETDSPPLTANQVTFRANGTATAAGFEAVYLRSRSAKISARYRVKVLGASGKITVEKWDGGAWGNL
jgi:Tfp pilus assembly protein FimT